MLTALAFHALHRPRPRIDGDLGSTSTTPSRTWRSRSARRSTARSATAPASAASATPRAPLDEALCHASVDLGGRGMSTIDLRLRGQRGRRQSPPRLWPHFLDSFARASRINIHLDGRRRGRPPRVEAAFKALALALRAACAPDPRAAGCRPPRARCDGGARRLRLRQPALAARGGRAAGSDAVGRGRPRRRSPPRRRWCCPASAPPRRRWRRSAGGGSRTRSARRSTAARTCSASAWACSCCSSVSRGGRRRLPGPAARRVERARRLAAAAAHGLERRRAGRRPTRSPRPARLRLYFAHSYAVRTPARGAWWPRPRWTGSGSPRLVAARRVAGAQFHPERSADARAATCCAAFLRWSDAA